MTSYVISSLKDPLTGETGLKLKNGQIEVAEVGAPSRANCCCPCETFECPDGACGPGCCCVNGQCVKEDDIPEEERCPDCPCPEGEACVNGQCAGCPPERVCGEECCPEGEACVDGQCVPSCDPPCGFGDCCVDGECVSLQSLGSGLCVTYTCPNNDDACDAGGTGILCFDCQANLTPVTWDPNDPNWYDDALSQCPGGGSDICSGCILPEIFCEDAPP